MLDLFEPTWQDLWADGSIREPVGSVFTRPEIVDLILDLAGYSAGSLRLAELRVLEPGCGDGAFVSNVVSRLIESEQRQGPPRWDDPVFEECLRAADISATAVDTSRATTTRQLRAAGCPPKRAETLASQWFCHTDFLLHDWEGRYDLVVGNPPYVRIEQLPKRVLKKYRETYATAADRADLYVAFIERGLSLLSPGGVLAFITANRFAKNHYGRALRKLIADRYHVRVYLNLEHTQPFLNDVSAYPAILVVDRQRGGPTRAASLDQIDAATLHTVREQALRSETPQNVLSEFATWYPGGEPWLTTCSREDRALHRIRSKLCPLESSAPGTRVGIGIATGADGVFVLSEHSDDIEVDRQIPLVMARDVSNQGISWSGYHLINPFNSKDDGTLVDLGRYPGLAAYLEEHADRLRSRHVARRQPLRWYRTIDRVWPQLRGRPKLLIPDIQGRGTSTIGYDTGAYYPHHNVYWIASEGWDLRALQTLLRSSAVRSQVRAYSVQMRGGSLRWQAQTLRRIHVPLLRSLPDLLVERLVAVSASSDQEEVDATADEAFSS